MLEIIHSIDSAVFSWVLPLRAVWLDNLFLAITILGKSYVVVGLAAVFSLFLWRAKKNNFLLSLWASIAGCGASIYLLKMIIARPRPAGLALIAEDSFSFPSGHAAIAVAFYGFVIFCLWKILEGKWARWLMAIFGILLILAIGYSRIYLVVHYFSDIIGGYLLGGAWLIISIIIIKMQNLKIKL